jgi:hypothetical protein
MRQFRDAQPVNEFGGNPMGRPPRDMIDQILQEHNNHGIERRINQIEHLIDRFMHQRDRHDRHRDDLLIQKNY